MNGPHNETERQFTEAYEEYSDAIFRHCYFRLSDRERALELVEEVFSRTWQSMVEGKKIVNIRAFLYHVAGNLIIDEYRRRKSLSLDALQENDGYEPSDPHSEKIEDKAEVRRILEVLEQLDEKYQEVVTLRYVDDMAVKDIAQLLGETENTVSVRINRAIQQLKNLLKT